ncbi:MAG: lysylphosphatidylglycerol synthase transmembrane domain-containing protein [Armatimonadota bacterium]
MNISAAKRRWIFWLLIIAFIWLLVSRFTEVEKLVRTLALGQWQWIGAAALLQGAYYLIVTWHYQTAFSAVELPRCFWHLLPVVFVALFLNVVVPTGGMGVAGPALFVDDAERQGLPPGRAVAATLLALVTDYAAFTLVLIVGLVYLFFEHDLSTYVIVGSIILMLLSTGLTILLLLGLWEPAFLARLLIWFQRAIDHLATRLHRHSPLTADWSQKLSGEFETAAAAIERNLSKCLGTFCISLGSYAVDIVSLYVLFVAFRQPIGFGALVAGFAVGIVFWIVSITPEGIGVVEGVMTLVYTSLGIPAEASTLVALSFRGLTFWLPLGIGFLMVHRIRSLE